MQEILIAQDDLGDSLDSVQTLIRKHEDFSKSAAAQEEKIKSVDEVATKLIERGHYASDEIGTRRDNVSCCYCICVLYIHPVFY